LVTSYCSTLSCVSFLCLPLIVVNSYKLRGICHVNGMIFLNFVYSVLWNWFSFDCMVETDQRNMLIAFHSFCVFTMQPDIHSGMSALLLDMFSFSWHNATFNCRLPSKVCIAVVRFTALLDRYLFKSALQRCSAILAHKLMSFILQKFEPKR